MKKGTKHIIYFFLTFFIFSTYTNAQYKKPKNQPFADQKLYHLGFSVGLNAQDLILSHSGFVGENKEAWFTEIPSYSVGFNVGIVGDRYINEYLNLRLAPTLYFGERRFIFKEQKTKEEYSFNMRSNYMTIPLLLKISAPRSGNYRPYLLAGGYTAIDISTKKDQALRFNSVDYGLEFGIGCNFYFPLFKLCPELKFSLGLVDLVKKDRSDLTDKDLLKYTQAISSGKSRMISLVFNFE